MPTVKPAKQKKIHPTQIKRHGQHHHKGPHYIKVYWPFMPLIVISMLGLILYVTSKNLRHHTVLSYATNVGGDSLLQSTNAQRLSNHKAPLVVNKQLSAAAQSKANDMARRNYWAHNTPDGQQPWYFFQQAGYTYEKAGENLAYGFATSSDVINGWMNSPGHRANMLDGTFQDVGFGFAKADNFQNTGSQTIVVAEYGKRLSPAIVTSSSLLEKSPKTSFQILGQAVTADQHVAISRLQIMTYHQLPHWAEFVLGVASGMAVTYLLLKHSFSLKKLMLHGESIAKHHPVLDLFLLSVIALSVILNQSAGYIR
ncbi:MAG: hypothetical protein NVS1B7_3910 [Candidatus Saccharimonadales bacterium]